MKSRLSNLKNLIWAGSITVCLLALLLGLVFSMSRKNTEARADGTIVLGQIDRTKRVKDMSIVGVDTPTVGALIPLPETSKGNFDSVFGMTFLCDKTILGLRTYASQYGDGVSAQFWTDDGSGLRAKDAAETPIVFVDGSLIRAVDAAMVTRPKTLVIYMGGDGLANTTQQEFIDGYTRLIESIRSGSPSTKIVVCSIGSISSNYQGSDGLTTQLIANANAWIRQVCINTGVYYADIASIVNDEYGYLSDSYLTPDGRSIAALGIAQIVEYFRYHYI